MTALIALALAMAPEIGPCLFGSDSKDSVDSVTSLVQSTTGTPDADAAAAWLQRNPEAASQLRLNLVQFGVERQQAARAAELLVFKATVVGCLRDQANEAANGSMIGALSAPLISAMVLACFGIVVAVVLTRGVSPGNETAANMLLGTLAAMATSVVSYWVGSSAGSARKDDRLTRSLK